MLANLTIISSGISWYGGRKLQGLVYVQKLPSVPCLLSKRSLSSLWRSLLRAGGCKLLCQCCDEDYFPVDKCAY